MDRQLPSGHPGCEWSQLGILSDAIRSRMHIVVQDATRRLECDFP